MTPKFSGCFAYRKCERNVGEAVEQEEKSSDKVERERMRVYMAR